MAEEQKTLNWMYDGVKSDVNRTDYLLGKKIDKNFEKYSDVVITEKAQGVDHLASNRRTAPTSLESKISHLKTVTMRMDDPLVNLRVKEEMRRRQILENPVMKLKMEKAIKELMAEKMGKQQKKKKKHKKEHKHEHKKEKRRHNKDSSSSNESSSEDQKDRKRSHTSSRHRSSSQESLEKNTSKSKRHRYDSSSDEERKPRKKRYDSESPERRRKNSSDNERTHKTDARRKRYDSTSSEDSTERKSKSSKSKGNKDEEKYHHQQASKSSENEKDKRYGLIGGKKKSPERTKRSPSPRPESSRSALEFLKLRKPEEYNKRPTNRVKSSNMTEEEREARLRKMQENTEWHYSNRDKNIATAKVKDEEEEEQDKVKKPPSFIREMVSKAQDGLSMEDRIKANKRNLQGGYGHMDRSFTKR